MPLPVHPLNIGKGWSMKLPEGESPVWAFNPGGDLLADLIQGYIAQGRLSENSDLHIQSLPTGEREESFRRAVLILCGIETGEMPDWALKGHELPGSVRMIHDQWVRARLEQLEDYFAIGSLRKVLGGGKRYRGEQETAWSRWADSITNQTWDRLIAAYNPEVEEILKSIQAERGRDASFSKASRLATFRSQVFFSDKLLYPAITQELEQLKERMSGIGRAAILGLGAMLANEGYDDLNPYIIELGEYIAEQNHTSVIRGGD